MLQCSIGISEHAHDAYLRTLDYDDDPEGERFESDPNYLEDGIPCPGGY